MLTNVLLKQLRCEEALLADRTLMLDRRRPVPKRVFRPMHAHMRLQIPLCRERTLADFAFERSFTTEKHLVITLLNKFPPNYARPN